MNESENTMYIILKDTAKAVMKRKFIAPFAKLFHHPKTETLYPLSIPPPFSAPLSLSLLSVYMQLPFLGISYKSNHTIYVLLCLAYFYLA